MTMCSSFHRLLLLWFYILCLCQYSNLISGTSRDYFDAKLRLVKYLTNNSEIVKEILPARDINTPVNLKIRINLHEIANVDEKNQAIRLTVWLRFDWNNPFLTWDPAEYGAIESVHANHELFWVPDVALFNEARLDEKILYKRLVTKLVINKDGDCCWNAPVTLLSQCKIDVSRFPFDKQECHVSIGSWTYSEHKMNTTYFERHADLSHFIENGEWEVESALLHNRLKHYGPNKLPYPDVTLTLKMKRRSLYYRVYIVAPSAVISLLALFSFILPSDNGERITLVITVLLANSVYMLIVSNLLPETSDAVPILGEYCLGNIITIALCLCATCLTLKCRCMTCLVPKWLEKIFKKLAIPVFVKFEEENMRPALSNETISLGLNNERFTRAQEAAFTLPKSEESNTEDISLENAKEKETKSFEAVLLEVIPVFIEELRSKHEKEDVAKKWKTAAKVLDRVFLLIFSITYVVLIVYVLYSM